MPRPTSSPMSMATIATMPEFRPPPSNHKCDVCGAHAYEAGVCDECSKQIRGRESEARRAPRALEKTRHNVPTEFQWAHFRAKELSQRVLNPNAVEQARHVVSAESVLLTGPSGAGKTTLAVCILLARAELDREVGRFVTARRLALARLQHELGAGEPEEVTTAMRSPIVLLDDLGTERERDDSAVPDVIWERHDRHLFTISTTWMNRSELARRYGDGFLRRLTERAALISLGGR